MSAKVIISMNDEQEERLARAASRLTLSREELIELILDLFLDLQGGGDGAGGDDDDGEPIPRKEVA